MSYGPNGIVLMTPSLDDDLSFSECVKDFSVEQLIAEFAVEGLAVSVIPGASWLYIERL